MPEAAEYVAQPVHASTTAAAVAAAGYRSDLTALSGPKKGTSKSRQLTTFQVDLIYPAPTKDYGSSSIKTPVGAAGGGVGGSVASPSLSSIGSPGRAGLDSPLLTGELLHAASFHPDTQTQANRQWAALN